MKKKNRNEHPHKVAITDIIKVIKHVLNEKHEIIIGRNGNEVFTQDKGGIV